MANFTIRLPLDEYDILTDEEYFYLLTKTGQERRLKVHDYAEIYRIPGLYECIVRDKLQYKAPQVIAKLLIEQTAQDNLTIDNLCVLDIGAGNGISGEVLARQGVTSIVGLDIIPEAATAAHRDYPGVYQQYHVEDLTNLKKKTHQELINQKFNALLMSGSLYHLPSLALYNALNLISVGGFFAVTLRGARMEQEKSGQEEPENAYQLFEQLIDNKILEIITRKNYQQRLSVSGEPIEGVAVIARKITEISD